MALLEVSDIHTFYGNIEALKGISLSVEEGEIVTLIGSNGAGKSTTLRSISGTIQEINRQGTTILLVEQNANYALEVASRGYVLETGTVAVSDTADALRQNPDVQRAYLGT